MNSENVTVVTDDDQSGIKETEVTPTEQIVSGDFTANVGSTSRDKFMDELGNDISKKEGKSSTSTGNS